MESACSQWIGIYEHRRFFVWKNSLWILLNMQKQHDYITDSGGLKTVEQTQDQIKITVKQGGRIRLVNIQDVVYIESLGRKAILHLSNETIEYYAKISKLEEQLYPVFFRTHRAYLINLQYVESYNRREVTLKNADSVLISKYRFHDFQKAIEKSHKMLAK